MAAEAASAASAELVIGWCIFGLLLLVGEALGVFRCLDDRERGRGRPRRGSPGAVDPPAPPLAWTVGGRGATPPRREGAALGLGAGCWLPAAFAVFPGDVCCCRFPFSKLLPASLTGALGPGAGGVGDGGRGVGKGRPPWDPVGRGPWGGAAAPGLRELCGRWRSLRTRPLRSSLPGSPPWGH